MILIHYTNFNIKDVPRIFKSSFRTLIFKDIFESYDSQKLGWEASYRPVESSASFARESRSFPLSSAKNQQFKSLIEKLVNRKSSLKPNG